MIRHTHNIFHSIPILVFFILFIGNAILTHCLYSELRFFLETFIFGNKFLWIEHFWQTKCPFRRYSVHWHYQMILCKFTRNLWFIWVFLVFVHQTYDKNSLHAPNFIFISIRYQHRSVCCVHILLLVTFSYLVSSLNCISPFKCNFWNKTQQ